jgi:hypothetical protein
MELNGSDDGEDMKDNPEHHSFSLLNQCNYTDEEKKAQFESLELTARASRAAEDISVAWPDRRNVPSR